MDWLADRLGGTDQALGIKKPLLDIGNEGRKSATAICELFDTKAGPITDMAAILKSHIVTSWAEITKTIRSQSLHNEDKDTDCFITTL